MCQTALFFCFSLLFFSLTPFFFTGESGWIKEIIEKYDRAADEKGVMIVPSCGFDSIPSDLGKHPWGSGNHFLLSICFSLLSALFLLLVFYYLLPPLSLLSLIPPPPPLISPPLNCPLGTFLVVDHVSNTLNKRCHDVIAYITGIKGGACNLLIFFCTTCCAYSYLFYFIVLPIFFAYHSIFVFFSHFFLVSHSEGISGGTAASAVASFENPRTLKQMGDPFLLTPADKRPKTRSNIDSNQVRKERAAGGKRNRSEGGNIRVTATLTRGSATRGTRVVCKTEEERREDRVRRKRGASQRTSIVTH